MMRPFEHKSEGFWQELVSSRVDTTRILKEAVLRLPTPPLAFACISGVGYYPYSDSVTHDEESAGGDGHLFARLTRDWEAASLLPHGHPTRRIVIRSGVVVGGGGGIVRRLYWPFYCGAGGPVGWRGSQVMPLISLTDLVRLFLFSVQQPRVAGVLNGVTPDLVTSRQFAWSLGVAMWRPAIFPLLDPVVHLVFGAERADVLLRSLRVAPRRVQQLGFTYAHPDVLSVCKAAVAGHSIA